LRSSKKMFTLKEHVANVCFECFRCFKVCCKRAKVHRDVAYVAMVLHVCCKDLLPMFHLCFRTYVASVFTWMLYMFAKVYMCFFQVFRSMLKVCVSNLSVVFQRYVASVLFECCICCKHIFYLF
jgi:hypothetical protein